jgi:hypothetical protein
MKNKKSIFYIISILLALLMIGGMFAWYEYHRKNPGLSEMKADYEKTAATILAEFKENEKKANANYSGKVIAVTAPLRSVDKNEQGFVTLALGDTSDLSSVLCSMDSLFSAEAAQLRPGNNISIKGICTGYNADDMGLGADVILNRCVIVNK